MLKKLMGLSKKWSKLPKKSRKFSEKSRLCQKLRLSRKLSEKLKRLVGEIEEIVEDASTAMNTRIGLRL